jgi:hypothetical protein
MLPNTTITKQDGNTGVVKPSTTGVLAIIAPAEKGTANQAGTYARIADALAKFGLGPLCEDAAYFMPNAKKPVLLIRASASTAAAYGTLDDDGVAGTSVVTASATTPLDDYNLVFKVVHGGTIGVAGITYTYSLDGGKTTSPITALGTATAAAFNAPVVNTASGVSLDFAAGTLIAGDTVTVSTTGARMTNSDLVTALEALRVSKLPWDMVLVTDCPASSTTIATLEGWLTGLEARGVYKMGYLNTRFKGATESEATFATAMATLTGAATPAIRVDIGCDAGDVASQITGLVQPRPVALATATRALSFTIGTDPAFVKNNAIPGFSVVDDTGNPKWHDESLFPGLDDLRLTTLRTIDGEDGVFITNANLFSSGGSDYVWDQHARTMNAAATISYRLLTRELSRGVRKQAPEAVTGKIYILEEDASAIEILVNAALGRELANEANDVALVLSRTDDLSSNGPGTLSGSLELEDFAYIKKFNIAAKFVRSISVTPGGA